jgi:hypothetical protein
MALALRGSSSSNRSSSSFGCPVQVAYSKLPTDCFCLAAACLRCFPQASAKTCVSSVNAAETIRLHAESARMDEHAVA